MIDLPKIEIIQKTLKEILDSMGFVNAGVAYEDSSTKGLVFNVSCPNEAYLLIGRQGTTLHAIQLLVARIVEKKIKESVRFSLDVDDYKMKREWFLKETANAAIEHIKKTGRAVALEPMPAFERRFVHSYVQENFPEAESASIDREPYRKVIVKLKK